MAIATLTRLHLRKRIRAAFSPDNTAKQLNKLKDEAKQSLLELEYLYLIKIPPLQLVKFYATVSPWCDRSVELYQLERKLARIDYGQYNKARPALVALAAQEERDPYGFNRAISGAIPTAEDVFLGDCYGLWTKPVSKWENERAILASEPAIIGQPDSPTIMAVIDAQASKLLNDGIDRWTLFLQNLIYS